MTTKWNKTLTSLFLCAILPITLIYTAVEFKEGNPNPNDIQVVPVEATPEPDDVELRLQYPNYGDIEKKTPVSGEMRLDWFPLGVDSDFPRKDELFRDNMGQSLHVFIDDHDYFEINEALFDSVNDYDDYFDQVAGFTIPFELSPGAHIIRAFPCRSYGESLKMGKRFIASVFYVKEKGPIAADLKTPYLTYNEPQGVYTDESKPVLLDFYIKNCNLSKDGYKVRVTIDNANQRFLYNWTPYYIYGLKKGTHVVHLELINPQNIVVPGVFNDIEKKFSIE